MTNKFAQAYAYYVHEDKAQEAKQICEELLAEDPENHDARMLLACAQADSDDLNERIKGRDNFLLALKNCSDPDAIKKGWLEENPLYNLALWEKRNGSRTFSITLFISDYLLFETEASLEQVRELYPMLDERQRETISAILEKKKLRD